jgi:hypothetical protein
MKDFIMVLRIRAECKDDAQDLIQEYSGQETDIEIELVEQLSVRN